MLCKYKNLFGKPGEGSHSKRVGNIAVVDVAATILVAFILSKLFGFKFLNTLITLLILGIIAHRIFCVRTTIDKLLFP